MKTFKNCGLALAMAAALAMTTGLTACSSENELTETPNAGQPAQPTTKGVKVTVTAGIADPTPSPSHAGEGSGAQTRSAVTTDGTTRTLKFTEGDRLYVYGDIEDAADDPEEPSVYTTLAGYLDIDATSITDGTSATFTGTLYTYQNDGNGKEIVDYDFGGADPLDRCNYNSPYAYLIHSNMKSGVYEIDDNKEFFCYNEKLFADDVETLMTTCLIVSGEYSSGSFALGSNNPIFNCTFSGLAAEHDYTATMVFDGNISYTYNFTTVGSGVGTIVIAPTFYGEWSRTITIKDGETEVGTIDLGTKDMKAKVYNVTRHWTGNCFAKLVSGSVNLASVTDNIVALDGATLTGSLANNVKISIAAGATVTLSGARINDNDAGTGQRWTSGKYAGLTCLGDATIILADGTTNTVRNFGSPYPGIQAAYNGTGSGKEYTLTIRGGSQGTGQLITRGHSSGAGIGSAGASDCGNITIEGGTINASSSMAAGIGSGFGIGKADKAATCGNISINGGNVTATGGGDSNRGSAGIGSSSMISRCGNISISGSPTVNATGGNFGAGIGSGGIPQNASLSGTCGTITISLSGGSVTATGGQYAAGIGTGALGTCGSINVERHPGASTQYVTVTADRNNGHAVGGLYDIGKGPSGIIKDGESNGTVNVRSNVRTYNNSQYTGNSSDGYDHN
jgi:hypothetical protein